MQIPPPLPGRPRVLTAAAVLCLIFGAFGLFAIIGALMPLISSHADPITAAMFSDPAFRSFQVTSGLISAVAGAMLVAAGIGLLKRRDWARKVAVGWSVYSVFMAVYSGYMTAVHVMPATQKAMQEQLKTLNDGAGQSAELIGRMSSVMGIAGAVFGVVFSLGIAITLIILVTRRQAKIACQPA